MNKLSELLDFCRLYFTHPYFQDNSNPWIRVAFLPSKKLLKKDPTASSILKDGKNERSVFRLTLEEQCKKVLGWNEKGFDAYYFLNAISPGFTLSARNEDVLERLFFCVDLDFRLPIDPLELVDEFGLLPAWIVKSSERDGFARHQIAWGVDLAAGQAELEGRREWSAGEIKELGRSLCHAFGSDSVHDAKRILRLPGTINWKKTEGGAPGSIASLVYRAGDIGKASYWGLEELQEAVEKFALTGLSLALGDLGLKDLKDGGRAQGPAGDFGRWEKAYEAAEAGKATVGEGGRHNALISWGMQMLNQGIAFPLVIENLNHLRRGAFTIPYTSEDDEIDFSKLLRGLRDKKNREDAEIVDQMNTIDMGEAEIVELNIGESKAVEAVPALPPLVNGKAENPDWEKADHPGPLLIESRESFKIALPPAANPIPPLSLREFADRLALQCDDQSEKEWLTWLAKMVIAVNLANMKEVASFRSLGNLVVGRFTKIGWNIGRYFSIPVWSEEEQAWALRALTEEDAKTVFFLFFLGVHAAITREKEKLAAHPLIKQASGGNKKFKLKFNCQRPFLAEVIDVIIKMAIANPAVGSSSQRIVFQETGFLEIDTRGGCRFVEDKKRGEGEIPGCVVSPACMRLHGAVTARYLGARQETPLFSEFLEQTFPDDPETHRLVELIIGYACLPGNPFQKLFSFEGIAGGGKGILAEIILGIVGQENSTVMQFSRLATDSGLGTLIGKSVCFIDEAEAADKRVHNDAMAVLKRASSGAPVAVRRLYENEQRVSLGVKFLLASNKKFEFSDVGGGGARRIVPLHFAVAPLRRVGFGLSAMILSEERDRIATNAAIALGESFALGPKLFDVEGSKALAEGRERLESATQGLKPFLEEILVKDDTMSCPAGLLVFLCELAIKLGKAERGGASGRVCDILIDIMQELKFDRARQKTGITYHYCRISKPDLLRVLDLDSDELARQFSFANRAEQQRGRAHLGLEVVSEDDPFGTSIDSANF